MSEAIGPIFTGGGFEIFEFEEGGEGYRILYLPDKNNSKLIQEGKSPCFYWVPSNIRIAQSAGDGDYKFSMLLYSGDPSVFDSNKEIVVGGTIGFTTTNSFPPSVLETSQKKLLERFKGSNAEYWGITTSVAPEFRIVPITDNLMTIGNKELFLKLTGEGQGNITGGEDAFSGMLDGVMAQIVWDEFHGGFTSLSLKQILQIPVWTEKLSLKISGNWTKIYNHFSTHSSGRGWWYRFDIQKVYNELLTNGDIVVEIKLDQTIQNADEMQKLMEKHQELIFKQFMEQASKAIFDVAPSKEEPAKTGGRGFWGFGGGFALKSVSDIVKLNLNYEEILEFKYNKEFPISSSLEGFYDYILNNPNDESKYFKRSFFDIIKDVPVVVNVNWPRNDSSKFVGEPIAFISVQIGYPLTDGTINWQIKTFRPDDSPTWVPDHIVRKRKVDVNNPPENWEPDKFFVKRKIHYIQPPSETEFPFIRYFVEADSVNLDPSENGTLTKDANVEIIVKREGVLDVAIHMDHEILENQIIEVELLALGKDVNGNDRQKTKIRWDYETRSEIAYWKIYTGQTDFKTHFKYVVTLSEKGAAGSSRKEWRGEEQECFGNGVISLKVPSIN